MPIRQPQRPRPSWPRRWPPGEAAASSASGASFRPPAPPRHTDGRRPAPFAAGSSWTPRPRSGDHRVRGTAFSQRQGALHVNINRARIKLAALAIAGTAVASATTIPAAAGPAPASDARILIHYDITAGQRPENITEVPGGDLYTTLSQAAEVERVTPQGHQSIVVSLPKPPDGGVNTPAL